jgi:rare lipoprotein A (peptidoglycan hydrolase)
MALIVIVAAAALPGSVGSQGPSPAESIAPTLFIDVEPALERTAVTTPTLDPVHRSDGALDDATVFLDPGRPPAAPTRPDVDGIQPAPPLVAVAKPKPAPKRTGVATVTSARGSWRHDPEVSWYGPGFYGNRTACGYALTKTLLGVAHRTLPCGTKITFRNPANGRTITVKVVDRGPYVAGRQWDLTGGVCVALDHCYTGPIDWRYA